MIKKLKPLLILLAAAITAHAQKQTNKQEASVFAPSNIKIDGKADEWGALKAHNNATNLFYTLANDNENLYLVVQAVHPRAIEKILAVGLTLTVNISGHKDDKAADNISVNYPQIENYQNARAILRSAGDKANWGGIPPPTPFKEYLTRTDSSVAVANKMFGANSKNIKIKGIKAIPDTLISAYNNTGIKVAAVFGNNGVYTYELQVPLKYFGITNINKQTRFSYSIKLEDWGNFMFNTYATWDEKTRTSESFDADPDLNSTTEFWAEYTLAKKP